MKTRTWVIGSGADCDIRIDSETISARHCRLTEQAGAFIIEDLESANGTYVGGERLRHTRMIRRGDRITLGKSIPLPWPELFDAMTIGRSSDNDFVVPLDTVSSRHARIERRGNQFFLTDLNSTNGTAINDPANKITCAPILASDDIFLGTYRLPAADLIARLREHERRQTVYEVGESSIREMAAALRRRRAELKPIQWYVERGGKKHGPYLGPELKALAAEGRVAPDDWILKGLDAKPIRASKVKGLVFPTEAPQDAPQSTRPNR